MITTDTTRVAKMAALISLCLASCKPELACRLESGGDWFPVKAYSDVSSAAAAEPGSLTCNVIYRIDKRIFVIGGCNRERVGIWPKDEGRLGAGTGSVGRRKLICNE